MPIEHGDQKQGGASPDSVLRAVTAEMDKRYEQRFEAQERATAAALVSVERATAAALSSAKEAVAKAETAAEKRFEGFNEKLNDITGSFDNRHQDIISRVAALDLKMSTISGTFMTKAEGDSHAANDLALHADIASRLNELDKRISVTGGEKSEHKEIQTTFRSNVSMFIGIAAFILSIMLWLTRVLPQVQTVLPGK